MNLTTLKCSLIFLGWKNTTKKRESVWRDEQGNHIRFNDAKIILTLNRETTQYPYIGTDLEVLLNKILKIVATDTTNSSFK